MPRKIWLTVLLLALSWSLFIGGRQWLKYQQFGYNGLDLAIYAQTAWSLSHGQGFASSIHDPSYLGDHLEPWLVPVAWVYRLWPTALTLLWVQTLVLASAIIPLAKLGYSYFRGRGAIVASLLFVVHPLLANAALYEFHGLAFALPILLWSIWWYRRQRWWLWLLSLIGLMAVREDMFLLLLGWGVLAAVERRGWRWWAPAGLLGLGWSVAAQQIIAAHSATGGYKYLAFYAWLGKTPGDMLSYPFRHPLLFLGHVLNVRNWQTVLGLLVSFGFWPLLSWKKLWPLALLGVQLVLLQADPTSFLRLHYVIPYLPFLAWAAFGAVEDFGRGRIFRSLDPFMRQSVAVVLLAVGPLFGQLVFGPAQWPWSSAPSYLASPGALRRAAALVKPSDRALATFNLLPTLANRQSAYSLNYLFLGRRQYSELPYVMPTDVDVAVVDWQQLYEYQFFYRTTLFQGRSGSQRIAEFLERQRLSPVYRDDAVAVYRRQGVWRPDDSSEKIATAAASERKLGPVELINSRVYLASSQTLSSGPRLVVTQEWIARETAVDRPITAEYQFWIGGRRVYTTRRLLGQGPQPASDWKSGEAWRTLDSFSLPVVRGVISVRLRLLTITGRQRLDRWATFRPVTERLEVLGEAELGSVRL